MGSEPIRHRLRLEEEEITEENKVNKLKPNLHLPTGTDLNSILREISQG